MSNTHWNHVQYFICKKKLFDDNRLETHYQQYQPVSINQGFLPDCIVHPEGCNRPEPSWLDFSRCTHEWPSMRQSTNDLTIDNVHGVPAPEDTPDEDTQDPQKPDLKCTPDSTKSKAYRQVVVVENSGGKAYGKATGLWNKHHKYTEQWHSWHPFRSGYEFQLAQSFSQQIKMWIDQHLRRGLDNFNIESFQSADALQNVFYQLDFGLCDENQIEDFCRWIFSHVYSSF